MKWKNSFEFPVTDTLVFDFPNEGNCFSFLFIPMEYEHSELGKSDYQNSERNYAFPEFQEL